MPPKKKPDQEPHLQVGPTSPAPQVPPPPPGLGGMDLSSLATQGAAETDTRISGARSLTDSFLDLQLEGQERGLNAKADMASRVQDFRAREAALRRLTTDQIRSASAADGQADRDFRAGEAQAGRDFTQDMTALERAFRLGAQSQPAQGGQQFGTAYIGADRGQQIAASDDADALRDSYYRKHRAGRSVIGNIFGEGRKTTEYDYASNLEVVRDKLKGMTDLEQIDEELLKLFNGDTRLASLALYDLYGYNPETAAG